MPPCTNEALEAALLGYVMSHPRAVSRLGALTATDFASKAHAIVFEAIGKVAAAGRAPTAFAVSEQLSRSEQGASMVRRLVAHESECPSPAEAALHLRELSALRTIREGAMQIAAAAERGDIDGAREQASALVTAAENPNDPIRIEAIQESVAKAWERLMDSTKMQEECLGIEAFDGAVGPLPGGSLTIIGGYTGAGKSSLALMIAVAAARNRGVGIVSCEDPPEVFGQRVMAGLSGVDPSRAFREREGVTQDEWRRMTDAAAQSAQTAITMAYAIGQRPLEVVSAMRRLVRDHGCRLLIVDYLQAIRVRLGEVRTDKAYSDAVKQMKAAAAELGVPLILCSQLRRPERKGGRSNGQPEPKTNDLKESGDIENEAEAILLCWRPAMSAKRATLVRLAKLKWAEGGALWAADRGHEGTFSALRQATQADVQPERDGFSDLPESGW